MKLMSVKKYTVGLDIGHSWVKMVELHNGHQGIELTNFGVAEIAATSTSGDKWSAKALTAVQKILAERNINKKNVVASIASQQVKIQLLELPVLPKQKLKAAVEWAVKESASYDLTNSVLNFWVMGKTEDDPPKLKILVVLVPKENLEQSASLTSPNGIKPARIDIVPCALLNSFVNNYEWEKETVALVDIGFKVTNIVIIRNKMIEFTRGIPFGANIVWRAVKNRLGISPEEAVKLTCEYGFSKLVQSGENDEEQNSPQAQQVYLILAIEFEQLIDKLRLFFGHYQAQSPQPGIDRIVLSGGATKIRELGKFLSHKLGTQVEIAEPFRKIKLATRLGEEERQYLKESGAGLNVAMGLALSKNGGINLLPVGKRKRLALDGKLVKYGIAIGYAMALIILAGVYHTLNLQIANYQKELTAKTIQLDRLQPTTDEFRTITEQLKQWAAHYALIKGLRADQIHWVEILTTLNKKLPQKAWLLELSTKDTDNGLMLAIKGSIKNSKLEAEISVIDFIKGLEKSPHFDHLSLESTTKNVRYGNKVVDFNITGRIKQLNGE